MNASDSFQSHGSASSSFFPSLLEWRHLCKVGKSCLAPVRAHLQNWFQSWMPHSAKVTQAQGMEIEGLQPLTRAESSELLCWASSSLSLSGETWTMFVSIAWEGAKETEPDFPPCLSAKGQKAKGTNWNSEKNEAVNTWPSGTLQTRQNWALLCP